MEAVPRKSPLPNAVLAEPVAAPKLTIEKFADGAITCLKFVGTIDEGFEGKKLGRSVDCETLVLDLGGVKKISSFGIREWVDFVSAAAKQTKQMLLIECAPKVVDQLNMVANFTSGGRVFSFYAPFRCDYCDSEHRVLLEMSKDYEAIKTMKLAERPCPACRESMYFDEEGSTFFSFVLAQGAFQLDADVVAFLAAKLDYRVGTIDAKLQVDKIIEGRVTYLRLAGDLNNTFPRDKLAEGLEGIVVVDIGASGRIEPAGAAEWRSFVQQIAPIVEQLCLIGVTPAFLEKLCGRDDLGKGVVVDLTLPYACGSCGTTTSELIDVAEHHAVLKFATAPELRCPACKEVMQCAASEQLMTVLPGLPRPELDKTLERTIGVLRQRKLDKKPSSGLATLREGKTERRSSSRAIAVVLIALVAAVIAGGLVFYSAATRETDPGPFGLGAVAARSAPARPDWIPQGAVPGQASCIERGGGLVCVGVSTVSPSQEDAEDEASDAALEAIASELGKREPDKAWRAAIVPMYAPARDSKLAALARDAQSTQAHRDVRDGRHAVALALRPVAPPAAARYWEAFDARDGRRVVAFAQVTLAPAEARRLTAAYASRVETLGATALPVFPELAWRFPRVDHGAVIAALDHGPLQDLGLAEHYVVLAVDGRDVVDAESFAKIAAEELALLDERGGALRLLVQTETGDPREFSAAIAGKKGADAHGHGHRGGPDPIGPGGVNVWDRYGGDRGQPVGRDDPTK